ncbi:MAG: hypothetical protein ABSA83_15795 [Verrucomicrobiota bacterium]|jgi:hypothetical protein
MNHPELLLIPLMMLLDYFLTVWGAVLSERKYRHHFKIEHYELNPAFQSSVARKQWLNPKHLGIVSALTVICFWWSSVWRGQDVFAECLFGYLTILFASIIGRHASNILTFYYHIRHPECVSGEVRMSHLLALNNARFRGLSLFFPLILIAFFSPSPFVIGGVLSQVALFFVHLKWLAKAKVKMQTENPA